MTKIDDIFVSDRQVLIEMLESNSTLAARVAQLEEILRAGQDIYDQFETGVDLRNPYGKRTADVQMDLDRWCYRTFAIGGIFAREASERDL